MLNPNPEKRLTVTQVRETVETIINAQAESRMDRVVPEINEPSQKSPDFHYCSGIRLDQFNNVSVEYGVCKYNLKFNVNATPYRSIRL